MARLKFWSVYISIPPVEEKKWATNKTLGVAAKDVSEVVALVTGSYPDATIYNIQHRGEINLYPDNVYFLTTST